MALLDTAALLTKLRTVANRTLSDAGPRYAPSLDPAAPNLEIVPLQRIGDALTQGTAFSRRIRALAPAIIEAGDRDERFVRELFPSRQVNLRSIIDDLDAISSAGSVQARRTAARSLRRHLRIILSRLDRAQEDLWEATRRIEAVDTSSLTEGDKRAHNAERESVQSRLGSVRRLVDALEDVSAFADGDEGAITVDKNSVLILGAWGTGKTHILCDLALQSLDDGTPTLVVLANALRTDIPPLDAIADLTGLADTGSQLLKLLGDAADRLGRRAVVMIDALNESDREAWRRALPSVIRDFEATEGVSLVVSCRTPFDSSLVSDAVRRRMLAVRHPGFEEQEFDAQLEFFRYYNLPALHVPLLTSEFSRPLFLRLMCEGIKDLGKRSQKNHLRDLASGQKSMTFVLERFVKEVSAAVEDAHSLPRLTCWLLMKGEPRKGRLGLAGVLASQQREWLTPDEVIKEVRVLTSLGDVDAKALVMSMTTGGLLIKHARYHEGAYSDVFMLPYQRFSDHLVARHLLDAHLDISSTTSTRRCFFKTQRLGAVFLPDRWGREFAEPGIASALMIEFPERVRRLAEREGSPTELLYYLPMQRRMLYPVVGAFLEGLYWRPTSSVGRQTETMVTNILNRPQRELQARTYEVLVGLAMREGHPLGSLWLLNRLSQLTMSERDVEWSEFVRGAESYSNLQRLLLWAEREDHSKVEQHVAIQAMRVAALLLTTNDRLIRDRATRALVLMGEAHPQWLFDEVPTLISMGDAYITERVLAACYGVCMRVWASESPGSAFEKSLVRLGAVLIEQILRPGAAHSTWHALTRGYAIGVLQILRKIRPRALSADDRRLLTPAPGQATSPFRSPSRIRKADVEDPEHGIRMDFGNYTIGRLVPHRANYDFEHREYAAVRKQIADYMRRLGYSTAIFGEIDKNIDRFREYRRDASLDRYGKKYAWIAYFEMYGLRQADGKLRDDYHSEPRPSDSDIDPSFPREAPIWSPVRIDVFAESPVDLAEWIATGKTPSYADITRLAEVDGVAGDWTLLDASMHDGDGDGREVRGWLTSIFVPVDQVPRIRDEIDAGRGLGDRGFPEPGADYYTYHGEIPWSGFYGSDVRTPRGHPKHLNDRAFVYFDTRWRRGIRVEDSCRRWSWEDYHSPLNQAGGVVFPAPPIADFLKLRIVGDSSDLIDENGRLATMFRRAEGPGYGSFFLYMRRDLLDRYADARSFKLVQAVVAERSVSYRSIQQGVPESIRAAYSLGTYKSERAIGLDA